MTLQPDPRELLVSTRVRRLEGGSPPHLDPDLARVRRGYFRRAGLRLTVSEQHRLRIFATAAARHDGLVFSHASAAELWDCPQLASDLRFVHATRPGKARRTTAGVQVHRSAIPEDQIVTLPSGLQVTSRAWTAVEVAADGDLPQVLLPLDALVRQIAEADQLAPDDVTAQLSELVPERAKGRARALRHLELADARSGSAGESLSRGQMVLLEVPMPQLQVAFARGDEPGHDVVDFDWAELGRFGEFDGMGKYRDQELAAGRTPEEVLWDEKRREDRVRRHRPIGARWGWVEALSTRKLGRVLAQAGIEPRSKMSR